MGPPRPTATGFDAKSPGHSAFFLPSHQVDNHMRQPDRYRGHADPLQSVRNLIRELGGVREKGAQHSECADAERYPAKTREQQDALDIPGAAPDLLFERRQFDPLLNRGQPLAMNHDPPVMPEPL